MIENLVVSFVHSFLDFPAIVIRDALGPLGQPGGHVPDGHLIDSISFPVISPTGIDFQQVRGAVCIREGLLLAQERRELVSRGIPVGDVQATVGPRDLGFRHITVGIRRIEITGREGSSSDRVRLYRGNVFAESVGRDPEVVVLVGDLGFAGQRQGFQLAVLRVDGRYRPPLGISSTW